MADNKKVVKGGFRSTLALLISIIALALSVISYQRTSSEADLKAQINELRDKLKTTKQETADRLNKAHEEIKKTLKNLGLDLQKDKKK